MAIELTILIIFIIGIFRGLFDDPKSMTWRNLPYSRTFFVLVVSSLAVSTVFLTIINFMDRDDGLMKPWGFILAMSAITLAYVIAGLTGFVLCQAIRLFICQLKRKFH